MPNILLSPHYCICYLFSLAGLVHRGIALPRAYPLFFLFNQGSGPLTHDEQGSCQLVLIMQFQSVDADFKEGTRALEAAKLAAARQSGWAFCDEWKE
ncbi:MAG: hypothetical protein SOT14_01625 [Succinivibrio sp.]|nr:hypothetical protein [Succinivibrio sp.]